MLTFDTGDYLELLSSLLRCDSSNPPGRTAETASVAAEYLGFQLKDGLLKPGEGSLPGISARLLPLDGERPQLLFSLKGRHRRSPLAFTGHMDVVPADSDSAAPWDSPPFSPSLREGRLYARGSCDMKGGLAAALMAFRRIAEEAERGEIPEEDISLILTSDEEGEMRGSEALLKEPEISRIGRLVVCEPTGLALCSAGRGRIYGSMTLHGRSGHGSKGTAENLIALAARLVLRMEAEAFPETEDGSSFWQFLAIHAKKDPCVLPDRLELTWDARLMPDHPTADIVRRLDALLKEPEWKGCHIEYAVTDRREGWRMPVESPFRRGILTALNELRLPVEESSFPGTTDGSKLRLAGMEVAIIGPGSLEQAHRPNEFLEVEEGLKAASLYYQLMKKGAYA